MKSQSEITAKKINQQIINLGIDSHFSVSTTDYGCSCYFTFYNSDNQKLVIRVSDHSVTNATRCFTEKHVKCNASDENINKVAKSVDLFLNKDKYIFIADSNSFTHIINGQKGYYIKK